MAVPLSGCSRPGERWNTREAETWLLVYNSTIGFSNNEDVQMVQTNDRSQVTIEDVTSPQEIARHRAQDQRHARNLKWLESHWSDLPNAPGRYVAVAEEQPFVADTAAAAWDWVWSEHPHDDGAVVMRVPAEKGWRIYANRW